jgi:autotransporter family porin
MCRRLPYPRNRIYLAITIACGALTPQRAVWAAPETQIGPGVLTSRVTVGTTNETVVGGTTIDSSSDGALAITNGKTATLDPTAGPSPGAIVLNSTDNTGAGYGINIADGAAIINPGSGGVSITTTGISGIGIIVQPFAVLDTATLNANGVSITTSGNGAFGVWATGLGSNVTLTNASIATGGAGGTATLARGVEVDTAGKATISDSTIQTTGPGGAGVYVFGPLSSATLNNVAITTSGSTDLSGIFEFGAHGVSVANGASITINGGTIHTSGTPSGITGAYGVLADGAQATISGTAITTTGQIGNGISAHDGATVQASNVTINTSGEATAANIGSYGINVQSGSTATVTNGSITTQGTTGIGLRASGAGSTINATGTQVETSGTSASAVVATIGGSVLLDNPVLITHGQGAYGILVGTGASATLQVTTTGGSSSVTTTGANADAVRVGSGGSFTSNGATLQATGSGANGLTLIGGLGAIALAASGADSGSGNLTATTSAALPAPSSVETANLTDSVLNSGQAAAIAVIGPDATINLTGSTVTGASALLTVTSGATGPGVATVNANASTLTGAAQTDSASTSTLNLSNGSVWNVTADSTLTNLTNNSSLIAFTAPTSGTFKTLMVANYVGTNGVIGLNTVLGTDNSPSDKLIIQGGTASGTTGLRITNAGGAGAQTQANGILVVDTTNGGTTTPGAFTLDGRAVAGPYEYELYRGGTDGSNPNDWYLRSTGQTQPTYRPEVAAYLANQHLAGQMFVNSLHDRLGEPQYIDGQGFNPDTDKPGSGWLRVVGDWEGSQSQNDIFKTNTSSFLMQGGAEVAKWNVFSGTDRAHVGVMGSYGYADTNAYAQGNPYGAKGEVEGWGAGAYGTWYQNDANKLGAYVDTWFQYGWFNNRVEGEDLPTVQYNAQGWSVSGETGYALPLRSNLVVEPEAQLVYVGYSENNITEPNGTNVTGANSHGWITRLGTRLYGTFAWGDQRKIQPYVTVNWWHSSATSNISFNDLSLGSLYPQNRYELKLGLDADLGKRWTGWTNVSGSWGAQSYYQYAVRVGTKYTW